ncbi:MAG TPA: Gfo/Idh/MocA family oxidoreductase [Acidimicrobiales bacterium]|jgi:1,5-anhydro-D-fructose reductase (1,5-anhydro-D-mannitol-forming)
MTVRVGFYGAGFISRYHQMLLEASSVDHAVVAVHDPDPARAEALAARHPRAAVVAEEDLPGMVDAVYVTTWTAEHARLVARAADAGVAVFCEKPLAADAATVEAMVAAVEAAGVVNQVGLVLRFLPSFRWLRHLVLDERAGQALAVVFRDDQFIPDQGMYGSTWRTDASRAGHGTLLEHSIHDVDILRWMLGPVTSVSATTREVHGHRGIDDVAVARFDFAGGAAGTLTSVWHDVLERPSLRRIEVFCSRLYAALEGDFAGPVRWQFTGEDEQVLAGDDLAVAVAEAGDSATTNSASAFLRSVAAGTPAHPSFADALPAHRVVDALYASAAAGGAVMPGA